jgi:hypothetical protein
VARLFRIVRRPTFRPLVRAATCALALIGACSTPVGPAEHLLLLDGDGNPHDPRRPTSEFFSGQGYAAMSDADLTAYLDHLEKSIRTYVDTDDDHHRIVIFVNGGLDTMGTLAERAENDFRTICSDPQGKAFPIFIGWDTGAVHSLGNHLFVVRRGFKQPLWLGLLTSPFVLAEDVLRGIIHVPQDICLDTETFWRGHYHYRPANVHASQQVSNALARDLACGHTQPERGDVIQLEEDPDKPLPDSWPMLFVRYFVQIPLHIPQNVLLDGLGTGAWDEMDRRARVLFEGVRSEDDGRVRSTSTTALGLLLARLAQLQYECDRPPSTRHLAIELVCHSMGTIVGNRMLRLATRVDADTQGPQAVPSFDHVVYMGAACSIGDYESAVFPYLEDVSHKDAEFYHVTLQERAECAESTGWGFVPYGSLLTWIDHYYAHTLTPTDRAAGRFTNLMTNYHRTPDRLRDRIHVKMFGLDATQPVHALVHGDFSGLPFWRPSVWMPDASRSWCPEKSTPASGQTLAVVQR